MVYDNVTGAHQVTLCWVKTHDDREVPVRYTEAVFGDELRIVVEVWRHYPASYEQLVFRHDRTLP